MLIRQLDSFPSLGLYGLLPGNLAKDSLVEGNAHDCPLILRAKLRLILRILLGSPLGLKLLPLAHWLLLSVDGF